LPSLGCRGALGVPGEGEAIRRDRVLRGDAKAPKNLRDKALLVDCHGHGAAHSGIIKGFALRVHGEKAHIDPRLDEKTKLVPIRGRYVLKNLRRDAVESVDLSGAQCLQAFQGGLDETKEHAVHASFCTPVVVETFEEECSRLRHSVKRNGPVPTGCSRRKASPLFRTASGETINGRLERKRKGATGVERRNRTVELSNAFISSNSLWQRPESIHLFRLNRTASASKGVVSWKSTPFRRKKVQVLPSGATSQELASHGVSCGEIFPDG
jgi:hypothetical protein